MSRPGLVAGASAPALSTPQRAGLLRLLDAASPIGMVAREPGFLGGSTANPPAPVPPASLVTGPGSAAASGGSGFVFALSAVLGHLAPKIPQLDRRFGLLIARGRPLPFVVLLDRPG
jgi:hypothetical protein